MVKEKQHNKKVNLLIMNPSPRAIKQFESSLKKINELYDVYRIKFNFNEKQAYEKGRQFFLSHPEYTHMAILPDDLIVDAEDIDILIKDLEQKDYPVISGICNFSLESKKFFNTMCLIAEDKYMAYDEFMLTAKYQYDFLMKRSEFENKRDKGINIERVLFSGFPFSIIRRDVLEKIGFTPVEPQFKSRVIDGMGIDCVFYNNCLRMNIPCYVDYRLEALHLKEIQICNDTTFIIRFRVFANVNTNITPYLNEKEENLFLKATNK